MLAKFSLQRLNRLQQAEDKLQQDIINARVGYESKLVTGLAANNNYTIYWYINSFSKFKTLPETLNFQSESVAENHLKAELFNKYFYSIFNKNFSDIPQSITNTLPDDYTAFYQT